MTELLTSSLTRRSTSSLRSVSVRSRLRSAFRALPGAFGPPDKRNVRLSLMPLRRLSGRSTLKIFPSDESPKHIVKRFERRLGPAPGPCRGRTYNRPACGRSVVVAQEPSKLLGRVRFPSPASTREAYASRDHGAWRSLVAHSAGGRKVAGSNPVAPIGEPRPHSDA